MYQIKIIITNDKDAVIYQDIQHFNEYTSLKKLNSLFNRFFRKGLNFLKNYVSASRYKVLSEEEKTYNSFTFSLQLAENDKIFKEYSSIWYWPYEDTKHFPDIKKYFIKIN